MDNIEYSIHKTWTISPTVICEGRMHKLQVKCMCEKQQETIANKYQEYKMNTEHYRLSFAFLQGQGIWQEYSMACL